MKKNNARLRVDIIIIDNEKAQRDIRRSVFNFLMKK